MNSTAVHEAGHAVIGRVLGMICGGATIVADDDSNGHSITADPYAIAYWWEQRSKFREMSSVFRGRILTFMAGAEAEAEILGREATGDGDDRYQIGLMLYELSDDEDTRDAIDERLRSKARGLVRRHRAAIERVARALEEQRTLDAAAIEELV